MTEKEQAAWKALDDAEALVQYPEVGALGSIGSGASVSPVGAQAATAKPDHWPAGTHVECACPHCGEVEQHQVANVRALGLDALGGECSACFGMYTVVAENGTVRAERLPASARTFNIRHRYDIGDQEVSIRAPEGFDARRAAIYLEFWAEVWFGVEKMVTNLGVAAALVTFYGCKHAARDPFGESIDMHDDRESGCPDAANLMADGSLHREGLRDFLMAHLDG